MLDVLKLTRKELLSYLPVLEERAVALLEQNNIELAYACEQVKQLSSSAALKELQEAALYLQIQLDRQLVDLQQVNVVQLQELVRSKKLSYKELASMYLRRIAYYNDRTIAINAIRCLNPQALEQAEACDAMAAVQPELAQGIFGLPVLIKDNINTAKATGMPTTAGSVALANNYPKEDAVVVQCLQAQGAIILGKTNLSEFANFITNGVVRANGIREPMPSGYSTLGGQVLCPYKPGVINPAGSSSGSGAAGAAALSALTVGTETSGSILNPSTANSLVGIKPTVGLISRRGIIPLSHSQDTAGPMTRNVTDAAYLLEAMKSYDPLDLPVTAGCANELVTAEYWQAHTSDYTKALQPGALAGKRLGIFVEPEAHMQGCWQQVLQLLKDQGAELVYSESGAPLATVMEAGKPEEPWVSQLLHLDFAMDMQAYLDTLEDKNITLTGSSISCMEDIVAYNRCYPEKLLYGQTILERCSKIDINPGSADMELAAAEHDKEINLSRNHGLDPLFANYKLDALISFNGGSTRIAAKAGYPSITVPAGYSDVEHNMYPINLQFTGQAFSEEQLIALAYSFEQAHAARREPGMAVKKQLQELLEEAGAVGAVPQEAVAVAEDNFATPAQVAAAAKQVLAVLLG